MKSGENGLREDRGVEEMNGKVPSVTPPNPPGDFS